MNCDIIILSKQTLFFTSLVPALILISFGGFFLFLGAKYFHDLRPYMYLVVLTLGNERI